MAEDGDIEGWWGKKLGELKQQNIDINIVREQAKREYLTFVTLSSKEEKRRFKDRCYSDWCEETERMQREHQKDETRRQAATRCGIQVPETLCTAVYVAPDGSTNHAKYGCCNGTAKVAKKRDFVLDCLLERQIQLPQHRRNDGRGEEGRAAELSDAHRREQAVHGKRIEGQESRFSRIEQQLRIAVDARSESEREKEAMQRQLEAQLREQASQLGEQASKIKDMEQMLQQILDQQRDDKPKLPPPKPTET